MSEQKKRIIPKFQKKLRGFLSDESGKITKEDVLKMGMLAMGIASFGMGTHTVSADDHSNSHSNSSDHSSAIIPPAHNNMSCTMGSVVSKPVEHTVTGHVNYVEGQAGISGLPAKAGSVMGGHCNASSHQNTCDSSFSSHQNAPVGPSHNNMTCTIGADMKSKPLNLIVNGHVSRAAGSIGVNGLPTLGGTVTGAHCNAGSYTDCHSNHGSHGSHAQW